MVDRQDIDALLIGSLYGELSSAEEARLTAHLESHPADRTALANLTRAREVVRESRILQTQFEPPQSISALLMQEAVRRAPKPREQQSWFQRFLRTFMTHPAIAAAAMLVLIIGVAGTVYMRQGDHFAKQTKDDAPTIADRTTVTGAVPTEQPQNAAAPMAPADQAEPTTAQLDLGGAPGSMQGSSAVAAENFQVQLRDGRNQEADKVVTTADRGRNEGAVADAKTKNKAASSDPTPRQTTLAKDELGFGDSTVAPPKVARDAPAKVAKPVAKSPPRLDVTTPSQAPKDFESPSVTSTRKGDAYGVASTGAVGAGGATVPRAPAATPQPSTSPPPPPPPAVAEEKEKQEKANDPLLAWAKEQHGKVIAAVKAGNCQNAANIAVQIANRAPAYYASNLESDRAIKNCVQYIAQQREKEAERAQRAKATQRRAADEAPAPSKDAPASTK